MVSIAVPHERSMSSRPTQNIDVIAEPHAAATCVVSTIPLTAAPLNPGNLLLFGRIPRRGLTSRSPLTLRFEVQAPDLGCFSNIVCLSIYLSIYPYVYTYIYIYLHRNRKKISQWGVYAKGPPLGLHTHCQSVA